MGTGNPAAKWENNLKEQDEIRQTDLPLMEGSRGNN